MIPILYGADETQFLSNGIGRLVDCLRWEATEERDGIFEVEFDYPVTGHHYENIEEGCIVYGLHDASKVPQPFDIYGRTAPIDGVVTFYAHHVSYRLQYSILQPFTAASCADTVAALAGNSITACPFTFWTDKTTSGSFKVVAPVSIKEILGGTQGSILDVYGKGEYEWDKWTVKLHLNRGRETGIQIRYGKNLANLTQDIDMGGFYSAVVPYWLSNDGETIVTLSDPIVVSQAAQDELVPMKAVPMDLSDQWEEAPTEAQLEAKARQRLEDSEAWTPDNTLKVDFVALWQTEEYKTIAPLEQACLCDKVDVIFPTLGIVAQNRQIIKTVYDGLLEKYKEMEIGTARTSFADVIRATTEEAIKKDVPSKSYLEAVKDQLSDEINAGTDGIIVDVMSANGKRSEMLILCDEGVTPDTPPSQCQHIWRINKAGIAYSSDYGQTYDLAITASGQIVADFITAGTMSANIINGGTLTLGGANNGNGVLVVLDGSGNEVGRMDNTGASIVGDIKMLYHTNTTLAPIVPIDVLACLGDAFYTESSNSQGVFFEQSKGLLVERKENGDITSSFSVVPLNGRLHECITATNGFFQTIALTNALTTGAQNIGYYKWSYTNTGNAILRYYSATSGDYVWQLNMGQNSIAAPGLHIVSGSKVIIGRETPTQSRNMLIENSSNSYIEFTSASNIGTITMKEGSTEFVVNNQGAFANGTKLAFVSSSSCRYKHSITDKLDEDLAPHRLYDLPVKQFVYNDGHPLQYKDMRGMTLPGFIAEDVEEIYPAAVIHGEDGQVESWDERRIIPGMLALIQEQREQIARLTDRVSELEVRIMKEGEIH